MILVLAVAAKSIKIAAADNDESNLAADHDISFNIIIDKMYF